MAARGLEDSVEQGKRGWQGGVWAAVDPMVVVLSQLLPQKAAGLSLLFPDPVSLSLSGSPPLCGPLLFIPCVHFVWLP